MNHNTIKTRGWGQEGAGKGDEGVRIRKNAPSCTGYGEGVVVFSEIFIRQIRRADSRQKNLSGDAAEI